MHRSVANISAAVSNFLLYGARSSDRIHFRITIAVTMFGRIRTLRDTDAHCESEFQAACITFYIKKFRSSCAMTHTYCHDVNFRRFVHCVSTCAQNVVVARLIAAITCISHNEPDASATPIFFNNGTNHVAFKVSVRFEFCNQ